MRLAMKCGYCGSDNAQDDTRCHLCGRRMSGPMLVPDAFGNAVPRLDALEERLAVEDVRSRTPVQTRLFPVQEPKRVIPFESISPDAAKVARSTQQRNLKTRVHQRPNGLNPDDPPEIQKALEFPEAHLETRTVEKALYTNSPVAAPAHRAMAVAYDFAMIAIGVGILVTIYYFGGVQFGLAKLDLSTYAVVAASVALLYKFLWALSGGDTPGMAAVKLRLINFDGNRPTREERLLRALVSIVSFSSLGLGLLWCLFDEEKLTWHDHITKTFASPRLED
jgi:uncharacterized RDD family membrane protein YckC